jgi:hypothetical protein
MFGLYDYEGFDIDGDSDPVAVNWKAIWIGLAIIIASLGILALLELAC